MTAYETQPTVAGLCPVLATAQHSSIGISRNG